jgi:hypothetical protein
LGIYVTIVGDSESCAAGVRADVRNKP